MRAPLLAFAVLAAGCFGGPAPSPAPQDEEPLGAPATCARLLVHPENVTVRTYGAVRIDLALLNCGEAPLNVTTGEPCGGQRMDATLHRGDASWVVLWGAAWEGGGPAGCEEPTGPARVLQPGERLDESAFWNGTLIDEAHAVRPAEPGEYVVRGLAHTDQGVVRGAAEVTLVPPFVPPPDPDAKVRFLLNATYRAGETVPVRVENVGDKPYRYLESYAACELEYYRDDGRPFLVPPGTHCDLIQPATLEPGGVATLFNWTLDECMRGDGWACPERAPLLPGTYHVRGRFHVDEGGPWAPRSEESTYAGWTFRIEP